MSGSKAFDYVIVGGGLQGCLLVHALAHHQPKARVLLVERGETLCGNHTWCFHESDVDPAARRWVGELARHRWAGYWVQFPSLLKRIDLPYLCIPSEALREATHEIASEDSDYLIKVRTGVGCRIESATRVTLGGEAIDAQLVVDCRGLPRSATPTAGCGFQTFRGVEFELAADWPATEPTVMDALADQTEGFEFLYELPLRPRRVLLEYTRFSDDSTCDPARAEAAINQRLASSGVETLRRVRTEAGCLPMPYTKEAASGATDRVALAGGYAGGWFHAATGYSVPLAVRFADAVAKVEPASAAAAIESLARSERFQRGFSRFLNRLLFRLVSPGHRWKIFRRFYHVLPSERIARFYAHRFNWADALRIVVGRPPTGLTPRRFASSLLNARPHHATAPSASGAASP
ncbi:MAG: lycopene beta-cyclase CrtY [Planctomycetota bacterium]